MKKNEIKLIESKLGEDKPMPKIVKKVIKTIPPKDSYSLIEDFVNTATEFLYDGKITSGTKLAGYVEKLFKPLNIEEDNKGIAIYNIGKVIEIIEWLQTNLDKKRSTDAEFVRFLLYRVLFPWQKEVFNDSSRTITMLCGRRSGKSFVDACKMIDHCLGGPDVIDTPNGRVVKNRVAYYIGLTTEKAKEIMWPVLTMLVEKTKCPVRHIDNSSLCIYFTNGSEIRLTGNANTAQQEKLRGLDFSMVILDEMQSQQGLVYFIDTVIGPILDGRNGILILSGTGPLTAGTIWEQYINNPSISHYHATMVDNPSIPNHNEALEDVLTKHGWDRNNITFRREYLGELAYDTTILVYPKRTYFESENALPEGFVPVKCYIGLDYGYRDCTAFAPVFIDENNNMVLAHEFKQQGMSASAKVEKAKELYAFIKDTYKLDDIWFIQDHNEQDVGADIFSEGVEHVVNAYKKNEVYQIGLVRDCLESGRLQIKKGDYFDQECDRLVWQRDENTNTVIYKLDDKTYHGDISDAVRYAVGMVVPWNKGEQD